MKSPKYHDEMEVILGDVRDYDSASKARKGCHAEFHLAALIGIPYSYVTPLAYMLTNVEGTNNVLEGAKNLGWSRCTQNLHQ
jgi:dTDP-glucose 4,6-dehydratase